MEKINVLIVDDSAIVRKVLSENLSEYNEINIIGTAPDPYIAREKIVKSKVDVILLDIEMPRMDGLTFLKFLMKSYPLPVIIVSSLLEGKNEAAMQALELGAVDIVPKPGGPYSVGEIIESLVAKIIGASKISRSKLQEHSAVIKARPKTQVTSNILTRIKTTKKIIAVGASTGGTKAFEVMFSQFQKTFPPTLAVIHMPENFTRTFANRLNEICPATVKEAVNNERLVDGHIYIAPGGNYHMALKLSGAEYAIKLVKAPRVNGHRPSVGVMFDSVAKNAGTNSYGVLLTGMGKDGATGLLNMKNSGAYTIAQDERSSIVFGMPKEAIDMGAADTVLPLDKITGHIMGKLR